MPKKSWTKDELNFMTELSDTLDTIVPMAINSILEKFPSATSGVLVVNVLGLLLVETATNLSAPDNPEGSIRRHIHEVVEDSFNFLEMQIKKSKH